MVCAVLVHCGVWNVNTTSVGVVCGVLGEWHTTSIMYVVYMYVVCTVTVQSV